MSIKIFFIPFILSLFFLQIENVHASTVDELRGEISNRNQEIQKLEEEIEMFQEQVELVEGQARTLESALRTLDITDRKLDTDFRLTNQKIDRTVLAIDSLAIDIDKKKSEIDINTEALALAIKELHELESQSLIEIIFSRKSFSSFWGEVESIGRFQEGVYANLGNLRQLKAEFESKKNISIKEKAQFISLKDRLSDQKDIIVINRRDKERLLEDTENKESNYRLVLSDRIERKEALEKELLEFEAQLRVQIDPSQLPETGTGILAWPLDTVKVTQYFGDTPFASKNPQVYNSKGHNGVDFRAAVGTPIRVSSSGIVQDIGDTDKECYRVSYGKWVLVQHFNGLTSLYAHLSLIDVNVGQEVIIGDVIGYSGNSGYSTGPHLHFGIFATQAVQVTSSYKSRVCGTFLKLPVSPREGYLNPLSYLPTL